MKNIPRSPQWHRLRLKEYLKEIQSADPSKWELKNELYDGLLKLFGDNPGEKGTWKFRITKAGFENPVYRIYNSATGRTNDFLHVFDKYIIIPPKHFDEKYRDLFPIRNDFYGQGQASIIDWNQMTQGDVKRYLKVISDIVRSEPHIQFIKSS